jgi:hypothetical protein
VVVNRFILDPDENPPVLDPDIHKCHPPTFDPQGFKQFKIDSDIASDIYEFG